jgi:hypothetical protein
MAASATYEPIATQTLGSAAASVTFSSLGSYTDLIVIVSAQGNTGGGASGGNTNFLRFNGDTASNYSSTRLSAQASITTSQANNATSMNMANGYESQTADNIFAPHIYHILNYRNATTNKTVIGRANSTYTSDMRTQAVVGLWRSTAAITSVTISTDSSGLYRIGSTFTLYGITAA